jgi:threonine/homoserine/homoserine lactone efflux protein
LVLSYTPYILHIIKYLGAMYLIYIGYKTFIQLPVSDVLISGNLYPFQSFKNGVLTNALNPKTTLFVISTYTQIVNISTPKIILIIYGGFMSFAHFVWFSIVALVFSIVLLREKMLNNQIIINKAIGSILCALGVGLLATQIR